MSTRSSLGIVGLAGLMLSTVPVLAKAPAKAKPKTVPTETAVIENTGSTNTEGYQIIVSSSGAAYRNGKMMNTPPEAIKQLFRDLTSAMPLTALPARRGMRSASFGTRTFIIYKGQRSPDLTFGGNAKAAALKSDVDTIIGALHLGSEPRHPALEPVSPLPLKD